MTGLEYLLNLNKVCQFRSQERPPGTASNSELRRFLDQQALLINGVAVKAKDAVPEDINSVVLFPKSKKRRCTLL